MSRNFVRQESLPGFGARGQRRLADASVTVVGVGGLGCPVALYLVAAGVGTIALIDSDHVTETNLHRQILYGPADVGRPKVEAAAEALARIAPDAVVTAIRDRASATNLAGYIEGCDLVIDATDTFATRLDIADAAAAAEVPVVWGAVQGYDGQVTVFADGVSLRALVPAQPGIDLDACEGGAVLGATCGVVGTAMAVEAVKLLAGAGESLARTLNYYDGRAGTWSAVPLRSADG